MFDIKKHLIKVQGGRQYLPVASRLIWFRSEHPDWGIDTKAVIVDVDKQYAVFEATIYNADGKLMAKGTKMENIRGFGDWMEKAETGAIGRALAVCGFGTQFAPDLDESQNNVNSEEITNQTPGRYNDRISYNQSSSRNDYQRANYNDRSDTRLDDSSRAAQTNSGLAIVGGELGGDDEQSESNIDHSKNGQIENCESCSATLKPSQLSLSMRKFGSALCPECQRKRKSDEAA